MNELAVGHRPMLVAIEGASGCGKTTLLKSLAEDDLIRSFRTPPTILRSVRDEIENTCSPLARMWFNLLGVKICSDQVSGVQSEAICVVDRYYFSTFIYADASMAETIELIEQLQVIPPSLTIILECNDDVRLARLARRYGMDDASNFRKDVDAISSELFRQRFERLFCVNVAYLSTDSMSPNEICGSIKELIHAAAAIDGS